MKMLKSFNFACIALIAVAFSCNSPPSVIQTEGLGVVQFIVERHDVYAESYSGPDKVLYLSESAELESLISSAGETIYAGSISQLGNRVANRHDDWIIADETLNPFDKTDFLRSSTIFRRILAAAMPLPET